jgi:hypothetical protein
MVAGDFHEGSGGKYSRKGGGRQRGDARSSRDTTVLAEQAEESAMGFVDQHGETATLESTGALGNIDEKGPAIVRPPLVF